MTPRSFLFVPGSSRRMLAKVPELGADALILDLEDSVRDAQRDEARGLVAAALAAGSPTAELWVRINAVFSDASLDDLVAVVAGAPEGIVLPKVRSPADVVALDHQLSALETREGLERGAIRILAVATELPEALFRLGDYRGCSPRLWGLTWGAEDLSAAVGASTKHRSDGDYDDLYRLARSLCLAGARAAGIEPVDGVYIDFRDLEGLEAEAVAARHAGFTAKIAIHPAQVEVIHRAFRPTPAEVERARAVVAAFESHPSAGAVDLDGVMLDRPHLERARRLLARSQDDRVS